MTRLASLYPDHGHVTVEPPTRAGRSPAISGVWPRRPYRRRALGVGSVLCNKWRVDARLGEGGMSTVFAATHRLGGRVAIKVLDATAHEHARARFLREGYLVNLVGHRGLARVLDDDVTVEGDPFLVLELLEGEPLCAALSREGRLPTREVVRIGIEVLDILGAMHAAGVVHRDVKPGNIFLCRDGGVRLLDLGIARLGRESPHEEELVLGTPAFMAPEQALGRATRVGAPSDLFALAATLWTSLAGREPRTGETILELLVAASTTRVAPLATVAPGVPTRVAAVVDRGLEYDAESRWQDTVSMTHALVASGR